LSFAPIAFDDLFADNTTVNLGLTFNAVTVAGQDVDVAGGVNSKLSIEGCLP